MEPKSSLPGRSPELPSVVTPAAGETAGALTSPELRTGNVIERQEYRAEAPPTARPEAATSPVLPMPVITTSDDHTNVAPQPAPGSPAVANDDELIEREWVDKAKRVIAETKDDPYTREQQVAQLQADYLWKRYGRQLKPSQ